jgi:hypothetical protein
MRLALALAATATAAGLGGRAEACPPLAGDDELVRAIGDLLRSRGIDDREASCPAIRARVERRGGAIAVEIVDPGGARIERIVSEVATAATVIESFVRADVGAPLLARRAVPRPAIVEEAAPAPAPPPRRDPATRGVQLFAAVETSMGSDHTGWMGTQLGACISVGPLCAAARLREAKVVGGEGVWEGGAIERESTELIVGLDIPLALGKQTLSPGFAAGLGAIRTGAAGTMDREPEGSAGLRADVHATLTVPIGRRLALDLSMAVDMSQATHVEWRSEMQMPAEPFALVRFGAGLRYGGM